MIETKKEQHIIRETTIIIEPEVAFVKVGLPKKEAKKMEPREKLTDYEEIDLSEQDEADTEVLIDHVNKVKITIRKNYSLKARRHLALPEVQEMYSVIKNLLLSYQDIKVYNSWRYERYKMHGQNVVKIGMKTSAVKLFFSKNPMDFVNKKYNLEVLKDLKIHEKTPYYMEVSGPRLLEYAVEIIQEMLKVEMQDLSYKNQNFVLKQKNKEELIKEKLIKLTELRTELKE